MSWARGGAFAGSIAAALLAILAAVAPAPARAQDGFEAPHVLAVRVGGDLTAARVVVDLDHAVSAKIQTGGGASTRYVIVLPPIVSDDGGLTGAGRGLVKAWRLDGDAGAGRLTLDLAAGGQIKRRFLIPPGAGVANYRYVIDIVASDPQLPAPTTAVVATAAADEAGGRSDRGAGLAVPARRQRSVTSAAIAGPQVRRVVVIDAGHGGHDPGAQSAGASEKDITLAAAMALKARLERGGGYKVVMTRASDVFIPLETRVQIARHAGAQLFIALHADSAGADGAPHGASVYTLSDHGETRVGQVLDGKEWFNRSGPGGDPAVGRILLDLTQRATLNRSAVFAQLLIGRLSDRVDLLPNSHRDAGYFVLLAPDVPAVLLEMGFITSPMDQARLTDPVQRGQLMDAVGDAIDAYFNDQTRLAQG